MLHSERDAHDGQREESGQYQVHDRELEPGQDDPDDVHDQRQRTARRLSLTHLAAEGREDAAREGQSPGLRRISKKSGVSMKELYKLFPKGPGKLAAKVSGLPKPQGCI